jgi:ABC-type multidrug transport system fused ATPase/permease subunit
VQEAIERAAGIGGRTVLAVAHRLATIQNANSMSSQCGSL